MTDTPHPARSAEFLSRLYDGDLDVAAASAFEAHRRSCRECRETAAAFEGTLAAFRSAPTAPPAGDLSARILRNIRAQSPSRRPFGVTFGIDIRWAGVFIAALLVVLISAPALLRRPAPLPAASEPASIPARILDETAAKDTEKKSASVAPESRREAAPAQSAAAPAPAADKSEAAAPAEASADEQRQRMVFAPAPPQKAASPAPSFARRATASDSPGGDAETTAAGEIAAPALRLSVRALDGQGSAPALEAHPPDERLASLRGREFVLIVEAQGRVREVQPTANDGFAPRMKAQSTRADANAAADPAAALHELRFAPGDRPRRLLVKVE
jgi:hypothetical protein